jgi:hypothetical protein
MLTTQPELPPHLPDSGSFAVHRIPLPASVPPYDDREPRLPEPGLAEPALLEPTLLEPALLEPALLEPALLEPALRPPVRPAGGLAADPLPPGPGWPMATPAPAGRPQWPGQFAQALAETLAGSRASRQITSWTTEQARRRIRQLGPVLRAQQRPVVRRVIASEPGPGVVEMTVIVTVGSRTRALAVRLERTRPGRGRPGRDQAWLCTAIEAA